MKGLLNEIKAMNKIAGTQLTKEQEIAIIKERLEQLNEAGGAAAALLRRNNRKKRERFVKFQKKHRQGKSDWYKEKITNPETGKQILVKTALGYDKTSPVYLAAIKASKSHGLNHIYNAHFTPKGTLRQKGSRTKTNSDKSKEQPTQKPNIFSKMKNFFGL
ncbi:hypothetical protein UFOVP449_126 [uncultured Caudovirales phage]|uniref:Uncharacterized protein n=1 Tax=uncultured Caudovirales phage TaxID=2100421 RepID=A0A6J5MDV7_9CAUD|nr:hypothetical protein UFOVP449_126 [uncultured Caudovirales phage]